MTKEEGLKPMRCTAAYNLLDHRSNEDILE
jgi:hypothetical protein